MATKRRTRSAKPEMADYRHDEAKRKNNPPAKIAAEGQVPLMPKIEYEYSPRLPPALRFDQTGVTDALPELLEAAKQRPLTDEEARLLAEALRNQEPWLEWAGKREMPSFAVDPVALHIHERVSAQAILRVAAREDVQRELFADPQQAYHEAVQFYQHDVDWANRLILGDSLQVMASLAKREDLAGKVQMIYIDPPYGIKFASNFQPEIGRRDVKDNEQDLTREPEMVKAYRDTWTLGIHSYLAYLRDRFVLSRELLVDTGSIFVQISNENVHRVRIAMDEVFGSHNFVSLITFAKTSGQTDNQLASVSDYLLWFARDKAQLKYRQLYHPKEAGGAGSEAYRKLQLLSGEVRTMSGEEACGTAKLETGARLFRFDNLTSQSPGSKYPVSFQGEVYNPKGYWKTEEVAMPRLLGAERLLCIHGSSTFAGRPRACRPKWPRPER